MLLPLKMRVLYQLIRIFSISAFPILSSITLDLIHQAAALPAASPVRAQVGITLATSHPSPSGEDIMRPAAIRFGKSLFQSEPKGTS